MSVDEAARMSRRRLLGVGIGGAVAIGLGATRAPGLLGRDDDHATVPARAARGPGSSGYGPLHEPDELGVALPHGFRVRLVARSGEVVPGTSYRWHTQPDGAGTFATRDGGWIYVSNSEIPGGVGALRFTRAGAIADAYPVLRGTQYNCSGGVTPWGTWLTGEEVPTGQIWECDPFGKRKGVARPALGVFKHEAAAVDPVGRRVYLNEDLIDGGFYRFTPARWPHLDAGPLEVATVRAGRVSWTRVPDPSGRSKPTRYQVHGMTPFLRCEGLYRVARTLYLGTTLDSTIYAYDLDSGRIAKVYDGSARRDRPLTMNDQMTASPAGELFVAEDDEKPVFGIGVLDPPRSVHRFLELSGPIHTLSEISGVAFDPSGTRLYFASQRAYENGAIYEVSGPFRRRL